MESFEHVKKFPPDRDVRLMYGLYPLAYGLFGTRALHLLYLSGFYPLESGGITKWHKFCKIDPFSPYFATKHALSDGYGVVKI